MFQSDKRIIAGQKGEKIVSRTLMLHQHMAGVDGEAFGDYCFEVGKNGSCEIDCLYVSTIGIFVIEVKNWLGKVYGSMDSQKWTNSYFKGKEQIKHSSLNPLKQNATHIKCIQNLLNKVYPIHQLVVFVQNNAPKLGIKSLINYNELISYVDYIKHVGTKISDKDLQSLIAMFKTIKKNFSVSKTQHIANIQKHHG